jgi:hypothetical protein
MRLVKRLLILVLCLWLVASPAFAEVAAMGPGTRGVRQIHLLKNNPYPLGDHRHSALDYELNPVMFYFFTSCPTGYSYVSAYTGFASGYDQTDIDLVLLFNGAATNSITDTNYKDVSNGGQLTSATGLDIVVCDALTGGNILDFHRVRYVNTTGELELRFKHPSFKIATPNTVFVFRGKSGASDLSNPAGVYSNGYVYVSQMEGNSNDATGNGHNGADTSISYATSNGWMGQGGGYAGSSKVTLPSAAAYQSTNVTVEAWVKPTSLPNAYNSVTSNECCSATNTWTILVKSNGKMAMYYGSTNYDGSGSATISTGTFYKVTLTYTSPTLTGYVNGTFDNNYTNAQTASGTTSPLIGDSYFGGRQWQGAIDGFMISNTGRTGDWINTRYRAESNNSLFWSVVNFDGRTPAGLTSGAYCIQVPLNHLKVANTDQSDVPFPVMGVYPWLASLSVSSGNDIRWFSDSGCTTTPLHFYRADWNGTAGLIRDYVRVPTYLVATDTNIYLKVGDPADSSDASDAANVWPSSLGYVSVYLGSYNSLNTNDVIGTQPISSCTGDVDGGLTPLLGGYYHNTAATQGCGFVPVGAATIGGSGTPVGSQARHIHYWFRATPNTVGVCNSFGGACMHFGWGKANSGFEMFGGVFLNFSPTRLGNFTDSNYTTGMYLTPSTTPTFTLDQSPHSFDADYAAGSQIGTGLKIYRDGVKATSPTTLNSTTVLNTANNSGASGNVSVVEMFSSPAHASATWTGFVWQAEIINTTWSDDFTATRTNIEANPSAAYSFGTAATFTPAGGSSGKQLIPGIITKLQFPNGNPVMNHR